MTATGVFVDVAPRRVSSPSQNLTLSETVRSSGFIVTEEHAEPYDASDNASFQLAHDKDTAKVAKCEAYW